MPDAERPDYGDDLGYASKARPSSIETVGAEWRGQFKDGGVSARVMRDATVHDILLAAGRLSRAQHEAADRLYGLWCSGGFHRPVSGGYGQRAGGRSLSTADIDDATAEDEYRAVLRSMPMHLAIACDTLMLLEWRPANLAAVRDAMDWLVKEWGL